MSDDYVKMMRERVEALEKRMNRFELVHEQHVAQAIESRNQRDERIEELEEKCGTTLELMERLEELEHWHEDHEVERLRQDRWHATRDAALMGLLAKDACSGCHNDEFIRSATVFADRAHGPLEAKAPVVETYNMTAAYVAEVNALVEAARKHVHEERDTQYAMPTDELEAALKPFEAVKGGL